ncbi:MFS general substrate transporter [Venturia nashicola]|nr:MFS general substrate transporter [Venturia nashicola]
MADIDNHSHPQSRGPAVLIVTVIMMALATIFVLLRMVSRIGIVKRVTLDDYFMMVAWVIAFGLSFAICYGTRYGLGRHQIDIPEDWNSPLKKSEYVFSVLYVRNWDYLNRQSLTRWQNPALMATKTSILLFYLNLSKSEKIFRWATFATLAVVNLAAIALTFLNTFQCSPVGAAFKTPVPAQDHCQYIVVLYLSSAPVNIITDLAILFLPMPILTGMRLPSKQKIILIITFGFGFFVAVVDVIRIVYLQDAATARLENVRSNSATDARNTTDVPWYSSLSYMWSAVEVTVGIMCANVPGMKPLVSRFMPQMLRDLNRTFSSGESKIDIDEMAAAHRIPSLADSTHHAKEIIETHGTDRSESSEEGGVNMIDFLTTPDMAEFPHKCQKTQTALTNTTRHTRRETPTFIDFVNMKRSKSMVQMTVRESLFPNAMVTILFLVWGIAYGFLDTLNAQFQIAAKMTTAQTLGIHSAYFSAYLIGTLTFGRLVLKHWGFKACYMVGLCVYACGTLIFWPSAVLTSFPAFLVSNFIVGLGLSTLEISANPFVALCGPPEYMEIRLNLSQGVQAIGSVVSPLLAQKVLFKNVAGKTGSLIDVQWTYLAIALFTVLLAVAFYYVPLPESTNQELEDSAERADFANLAEMNGVRVVWITLALGVLAQFCYVGAQESISTSLENYIHQSFHSPISTSTWSAVAHTCFALGRFFAAALSYLFSRHGLQPRHLLSFFLLTSTSLSIVSMFYQDTTSQITIMLLYFFEAPIFSLIFATCLRGLGKWTKDGSALLTAAISGGAVWPAVMDVVAREFWKECEAD